MTPTLKKANYVINEWLAEGSISVFHSLLSKAFPVRGETHMPNRWVTGVRGYLFMSLFHQSFHRWVSAWWGFFLVFLLEVGNISVVMLPLRPPHLWHLRYYTLDWIIFLRIRLWSRRHPGIRNHRCSSKMTFAVFNRTLCCALRYLAMA